MAALNLLVVPPAARHTATVIFAHGLGDTGHGWKPLATHFRSHPALGHIKWVLPHSPMRAVTVNMGAQMPAWFDIPSFDLVKDDETGMLESIKALDQLVTSEIEAGINPDRIVMGGFSQGAAMTLLTGMTTKSKLAGLVVLSGRLPLRDKFTSMVSQHAPLIPIFWGHGTLDSVVKYQLGRLSADFLISEIGVLPATVPGDCKGLTFNSYEGLGHSTSEQEMDDLREWMKKILPEVNK